MHKRWTQLRAIVAAQSGAATCEQAKYLGISRVALQRREDAGEYSFVTERVFVSDAAPDTFDRRASVGLLEAGDLSAISLMTGANLYGIPGFLAEPIQILRPHGGPHTEIDGIEWHFTRFLPEHHIIVLNEKYRVAIPARVLADLGGHPDVHAKRAERAFDNAFAAGLVDRPQLVRLRDEWCKRGRGGSAFLREYLDSRPTDWVPPASGVQRRFIELIKGAGMPEPRSEVNVGNERAWLGRVDCLDPEFPLIAEIDSDRFHIAPLDQRSDELRDGEMTDAGFEVVRFSEHEVWYEPAVTVERWRTKRNEMRARRYTQA